ncbi:MAG: hypothetical protein H6832_02265 [Planctomycetes bacterium]|nr:hypothetical protein [Planctomycetota bacterium]MCB9917214.1 hypothetical protein [Planctomycetota bacterium]
MIHCALVLFLALVSSRPSQTAALLCSAAQAEESLEALCTKFRRHDQDRDGKPELLSLKVVTKQGSSGSLVLILVENRLDEPPFSNALQPRIRRLVEDLAAEGRQAAAIRVALAVDGRHRDGRFVLALRDFLRAVHSLCVRNGTELEGCVLLGHFPDAFLVRTCNWRKKETVTIKTSDGEKRVFRDTAYVRRVPEDVAHRADIVLADLDGAWEHVYVEAPSRFPRTIAAFDKAIPAHGGVCVALEEGTIEFEDAFHISDGKLEVLLRADGGQDIRLFDRSADHECSDADRVRPNIIAHPDIHVSRIDARGAAEGARTDVEDAHGKKLLDASGQPQALHFENKAAVPDWRSLWEHDPLMECRLLAEYLDRNHAYRTGEAEVAWRPASLACGLGSGFGDVVRAAKDWDEFEPDEADVHGQPELVRVAEWLGYPAVLRTLRAHSDPWGSVFGKPAVRALDEAVKTPWSFTQRGDTLVPSLEVACQNGKLDWFLLRTLYENDLVVKSPSIYVHTGCHGISPPGAAKVAFDDPGYGRRQGAESILFFGNALALIGRAKVFYDAPRGFCEALGEGKTVGAAWARYFELESQAESWSRVGGDIGRKRSYFWSLLGDFTLKLRRDAKERR